MDYLPNELITYILSFLNFNDRKEASVVCKAWYTAYLHPSLQKNVVVKCKPPEEGLLPQGLLRRRLTHIDFGESRSNSLTENRLVSLLKECPGLMELDLSSCDYLFLSGRLLEKDGDIKVLRKTLLNVKDLKLIGLRHMTDVTFMRLVSIFENLQKISLDSSNIIFGTKLAGLSEFSPVIFQFTTFLKYSSDNAKKLKSIDLSHTAVQNDALAALASIQGLILEEVHLKNCTELSDKGIKFLVTKQHELKILDLSECQDLGTSKVFFSTLANNLPYLHTLLMRKCIKMSQCDIPSLADFKSLTTFDLGEVNNLCEKDLIKGLCSKGPKLNCLSLPYCPEIHQEFIIQLSTSNYLLSYLDLSSCHLLSDGALQAIIRSLTLLRTLKIPYCREVSDFGILGYMPEQGIVPAHTFDFDHVGCPCTRERDSKIFRKPTGIHKEDKACSHLVKKSIEDGQSLLKLSNLSKLENLDLSFCQRITDVGLVESIRFKNLRLLSLNNMPRVFDGTVSVIAHHNPGLEELNLKGSKITDKGVQEFITHCRNLTKLDISQCDGITNFCAEIIAQKAKRLRSLEISYTNITPEAVKSLESRCPFLKIQSRPFIF
ncbi:hypothetical protein Btru_068223 [Bulinus truncatus]|nr:hypothetical protein Btru_068223 [Bulinus truncatus]